MKLNVGDRGQVRRLAALRAMANQDDSPAERDIAREKLRRLVSLQTLVRTHEQREADAREAARLADETERQALIRRWERGEFAGITFRVGSQNDHRYRRRA